MGDINGMNRFIKILLLSIGHLLIDLEGIYLINVQYNNYDFKHIAMFFIVYNLIAFGLQPILGFFADERKMYFQFVIIGSLLPISALFLKGFGVVAIIISTIGNAMYHVGGGVISLNLYPNKAAPAGVFVAPGAIGVYLGFVIAKHQFSYSPIIALVGIIILIITIIVFRKNEMNIEYKKISDNFIKIILLILIVVLIRGSIGTMLIFTWKDKVAYEVLLVISIFAGKFLGGILGDKFGFKRVGILGLIVSGPLLLLGYNIPLAGMIGALFFNLTMGITLFLIVDNLGEYKGFAFGLTTLVLVIAYLPKSLGIVLPIGILYYVTIIVLVLIGAYALNKVINLYNLNNKQMKGR